MTWGSISLFGGFLEKGNPLETLIVIFENVSPKGFSWLKMKYFEISVLTANSRYLQTAALKKGKCHDGRCIHLYWLASRQKTKLIDLIWTWIDYSIIVSIILLPDCPASCTCFVSFSLFSRVTISVVQKRKNVVGPNTPLPGGRGWGGGGYSLISAV